MILASHGSARCCIMMAHPVHETVKVAANELQYWLYRVTGASMPVLTEMAPWDGPRILIGDSKPMAEWGMTSSDYDLGEEGFAMVLKGDTLAITGATPRGTLYGAYAFLEERVGVHWFTKDVFKVPDCPELEVEDFTDVQRPVFESREAYWRHAFDGTYAARNRMNGHFNDITSRQGGHLKYYMFHHSFEELVPPSEYYDEHPEYFSLVDGKRLKTHSQICLTNPGAQQAAIKQLKRWIAEHPDCRCFSISQNDWMNYCTCDACRALDEAEGSHAGTLINFVNILADAIAEEHPDVLLHALAYQYTRRAPKTIKPRKNVIIRLCSIECCVSHPMDGSVDVELAPNPGTGVQCALSEEPQFLRDLKEWAAITTHLYVWDYNTNFKHYLMPLPILDAIQANYRLYARMGVNGVFAQGNFSHGGCGNMAELYAYLQGKLLWNPECDLERHLTDFLEGYYGKAAGAVRRYLDLWQDAVRPYHMTIYEDPSAPFITDELLAESDRILSEALWRETDKDVIDRVERIRLGITYMVLCRMPLGVPGRDLLIDRFGWQARHYGVTELNERTGIEEGLEFMKKVQYNNEQKGRLRVDYKM